jgi:hypothetical protein
MSNGWTNYETRAVGEWLLNTEHHYNNVNEIVKDSETFDEAKLKIVGYCNKFKVGWCDMSQYGYVEVNWVEITECFY